MAHVASTIEVDEGVATVYEQWMHFEELPRCGVHDVEARIRWRAEVLTFEPRGDRTRVTLRVEYEPTGREAELPGRVAGALERFRSFVEERSTSVASAS